MLLACSVYPSEFWLTYKQATDMGGSVKKGEHGTPIVFWKIGKKTDSDGNERKTFILRYYTVFNASQCEGIKIPATSEKVEFNPITECEKVVDGYEDPPVIEHGGGSACYIPSRDIVRMPPKESFDSAEAYYATMFHELGHSTGAEKRLDRSLSTGFGSHEYSFEELVAELSAAFLCAECGISPATIENSAAYIGSWLKKLKSEPEWIIKASGKAVKAADHILGRRERTESEQEAA
jgi:antirestriction protein ArdC